MDPSSESPEMNLDDIDLRNPDLYLDGTPHEIFTQMRKEDPVHWNREAGGGGFWCITKYDDITAISKKRRRTGSTIEPGAFS